MMSPGGTAGLAMTLDLLSMPFANDSLSQGLGQEPPTLPSLLLSLPQGLSTGTSDILGWIVGGLTASLASTQSRQQTTS